MPKISIVVLVGLVLVAALFAITNNLTSEVRGVVTIRRLVCEPASEPGSYLVSVHAENTTESHLQDLMVKLTAGKGNTLSEVLVEVDAVPRGEYITARGVLPLQQDIEVCFAKFYASSGQELGAVFRP